VPIIAAVDVTEAGFALANQIRLASVRGNSPHRQRDWRKAQGLALSSVSIPDSVLISWFMRISYERKWLKSGNNVRNTQKIGRSRWR
jgi:hypothetical protein